MLSAPALWVDSTRRGNTAPRREPGVRRPSALAPGAVFRRRLRGGQSRWSARFRSVPYEWVRQSLSARTGRRHARLAPPTPLRSSAFIGGFKSRAAVAAPPPPALRG